MPATGWRPAWISAIEPPSLWPTSSGSVGAELLQRPRQHLERLLVEERGRARARRRVGAAVAEAREREHPPSAHVLQRRREVPPQADRSEPLVEQHERRLVRVALELDRLQAQPVDGQPPLDRAGGHRWALGSSRWKRRR